MSREDHAEFEWRAGERKSRRKEQTAQIVRLILFLEDGVNGDASGEQERTICGLLFAEVVD